MNKGLADKVLPTLLIIGLLFFFLSVEYAVLNAAVIVAVLVFERWKFPILMSAAIFYWIEIGDIPFYQRLPVRILALVTCLAVIAIFVRLKPRMKYPVLTTLGFVILVFMLPSIPISNHFLAVFIKTFFAYFRHLIWYLLLLMTETAFSFRSTALFLRPFWGHTMSYLPAATGPAVLMEQEVRGEPARIAALWAAVKILAATVVLMGGSVTIQHLVFAETIWPWLPSLEIPKMSSDFGVIVADQAALPLWQKWLALITHVTLRYVQLALAFGLIVGQARAVGFMIPAMVNSPWHAKSFGDFFGRLLYHYNRLLMRVFYPRIKGELGFIRSPRLKVTISIFLSILIGGSMFHYPRDTHASFFRDGFWFSTIEYLNAVPYFFVLAALVSTTLFFRDKRFKPPLIWRILRPLCYLIVFSVVYSLYMAGVHNKGSWSAYCTYLLSLLNLS